MTRFRPCIDIHEGRVKQIVGATLDAPDGTTVNFVSTEPASAFARRYRDDRIEGGHVIMLGPGNEREAREALEAYPGGLQIGGGIGISNAAEWLAAGASHAIVTSWLFQNERFDFDRLKTLSRAIGPERLVIDLSCKRHANAWVVATNRWKTLTALAVTEQTLDALAPYCAEFLIHAADVEGRRGGMDEDLIRALGAWAGRPITYAGGARAMADLYRVEELSGGAVDITVGSALDIFGGNSIRYADCVAFNRRGRPRNPLQPSGGGALGA